MKNKLYIIGSTGIPPRYGGFETFAYQTALLLHEQYEIHVACSSKLYPVQERTKKFEQIHRFFIKLRGNGFAGVLYDLIALKKSLCRMTSDDALLVLGCTTGLFMPFVSREKRKRIIIHIDGLEWKREKWNFLQKMILRISWKQSLKLGAKVLVDNPELLSSVPVRYHSKTFFCSYGYEHLPVVNLPPCPEQRDFALMIARAEPENNLELIMEAFAQYFGLNLMVISNFDSSIYGKKLRRKYKAISHIQCIEAIYDNPRLLQSYRMKCKLYLHGHSAGGTNPSLIEAMSCGIPILCWDSKFNRYTTENNALFFKDKQHLIHLAHDYKNPEYNKSGNTLMKIAQRKYCWKNVAETLSKKLSELR